MMDDKGQDRHTWHSGGGCLSPGFKFVFDGLVSGTQKVKTVLDPKFLNGFFIQENRALSVGGCLCSRAVHTVG
jgi:hypothetical protein